MASRRYSAAGDFRRRAFHLEDRGWIRTGMRADLVLVRGPNDQHSCDAQHRRRVETGIGVQR
jgi:alpha-D-ribose 1-methylphosphonate 5-triphosphate diphosphatase PhnM